MIKVVKMNLPKGLERSLKARKPKDMFMRDWYKRVLELGLQKLKDDKEKK